MKNKGMITLEYALLIFIVVAALTGMFFYLQRSICGKMKESADSFGYGRQYNP